MPPATSRQVRRSLPRKGVVSKAHYKNGTASAATWISRDYATAPPPFRIHVEALQNG